MNLCGCVKYVKVALYVIMGNKQVIAIHLVAFLMVANSLYFGLTLVMYHRPLVPTLRTIVLEILMQFTFLSCSFRPYCYR